MAEVDDFERFVRVSAADLMTLASALSRDRQQAEDLVQIALVSAYERWPTIRSGEELRYVRRCITNAHISRWRKLGRREASADGEPAKATAPPQAAVDVRVDLIAELRLLPARQRTVLVLRYLYDLPDAEISATLGIRQSSVRANAHRGLARLRAARTESQRSDRKPGSALIGDT